MSLQKILIANPKGGSGKSTLATNLAGWFAWQGLQTMLGDVDRQQSCRRWLSLRPDNLPSIRGWDISDEGPAKLPKNTDIAILDSPAGLHGKKLDYLLDQIDQLIVPVQSSQFDLWAVGDFLDKIESIKAVRKGKLKVGLVAMRQNTRTQSHRVLSEFLSSRDVPLIGTIRDTQLYLQTLPKGITLFDLPAQRFSRDREQWQSILTWLKQTGETA
ncbi:ParA family protein [Leeia oryzae]|uniref:ParA family protein n=1 Tax=Leeia oryzae TaxID=356662 RepID=UPI00037E15A6|nr:ParA family protein [Leeia oryzae]